MNDQNAEVQHASNKIENNISCFLIEAITEECSEVAFGPYLMVLVDIIYAEIGLAMGTTLCNA